ncbi:MAG: hypothetical protein N2510_01460 [Ignavibacteria bacterium]|nr:hypothetical protein [Ignavibacteria bacterium]
MSLNKSPVSFKFFADKLIDYAGMFPPASLSLTDAVNNYTEYLNGKYSWMLNRFIVPAKSLKEFQAKDSMQDGYNLSVILSGGSTESEFRKSIQNDIKLLADFKNSVQDIKISSLEALLPSDLIIDEKRDDLLDFLIDISSELERGLNDEIPLFLEAGINDGYEGIILNVTEAIASLNKSYGFKLRTGGLKPENIPSPAVIAYAILSSIEFGIPMKCTAGLHHPVRNYDKDLKTIVHGFFNVFISGIMAYALNISEEEIVSIINEEDVNEFQFTENYLKWKDYEVTLQHIREGRENLMVSFGSCSFTEPVEDLIKLKLI